MGGGIPRGLSTSSFAEPALAAAFVLVFASAVAPANKTGDIPSSDNKFRLFISHLALPNYDASRVSSPTFYL
jgi:hypothetical protein